MARAHVSRIIAGSHGGRRLKVPAGSSTRPTTDRVREALFSTLASWAGSAAGPPAEALSGLAFCDLYAGSGAVGLEAASRGAAPVWLVEAHRRAASALAHNRADLGLAAEVRAVRVEAWARSPAEQMFDVVFADPPYELAAAALDAVVNDLVATGWASPDGLLVLERAARSPEPRWPEPWQPLFTKTYGETRLHYASAQSGRVGDRPASKAR